VRLPDRVLTEATLLEPSRRAGPVLFREDDVPTYIIGVKP
jgi:hypothetical protein